MIRVSSHKCVKIFLVIKYMYEGRSESLNNCLIIQLIFIVKQKETYLI